jgi:AcrR family transcriptional regulator
MPGGSLVPAKRAIQPRKEASQERSRATVEAILRAAAHILVRSGYEATTTNRVAVAAGVSIGSLYQYFPNKEAIVGALIDRHLERQREWLRQTALTAMTQPIEQAVRALIEGLIAAHRVDPALHRVFFEEMPRVAGFQRLESFEAETLELVKTYLAARLPEVGERRSLDVVAFLVVRAVEGATHGAVLFRHDLLAAPTFVDELVTLVVRFLRSPA